MTDSEVLRAILTELQTLNARGQGEGMSSLAIEDMAKGPPKITSKIYDAPLTRDEIDAALDAHGYAHRRAEQMAMDGWAETLAAVANARNAA